MVASPDEAFGPVPDERRLPPGQRLARGWPVTHYGRVPRFDPARWGLRICGALAGPEVRWSYADLAGQPRARVRADLHCVTRFTVPDRDWEGIPTTAVLAAAPPRREVSHVMVWAEYGYGSCLRLADFTGASTLLATHCGGAPLSPEHGFPLRLVVPHLYGWKGPKWVRAVEFLTAPRRGFWEQRGCHDVGEVWREQRFRHRA